MKVMNITAGTLVRTVTLVVALLNLVLTSFGKNPLPFSDEQIYTGRSALVTVAAALAAWWKNNSFTCCARQAESGRFGIGTAHLCTHDAIHGAQ